MTSQTRPRRRALWGRRDALRLGAGALAGVAGGAALAACSLDNPVTDDETPATQAVDDLAPDVAVAVEAVTLVRGAATAVTLTGERHSALAPGLAGLLAAHRSHLEAVVDAVPDEVDTSASGSEYVVPARPARALAQLTAAERTLHDALVALAIRAESGPFARLLGSMAAAVSQQLRELSA